jgi:hypothetical protein
MKKFTEKYLEKLFEDNFIEDDELFDCLKNRTGEISLDQKNQEEAILTIKLKMFNE